MNGLKSTIQLTWRLIQRLCLQWKYHSEYPVTILFFLTWMFWIKMTPTWIFQKISFEFILLLFTCLYWNNMISIKLNCILFIKIIFLMGPELSCVFYQRFDSSWYWLFTQMFVIRPYFHMLNNTDNRQLNSNNSSAVTLVSVLLLGY